jgi:glycosyltransferase involved in cell wall biosynthesis
MNVLLITFSFPPAGGVGVLRAVSLARYLPENDLRVDVLTARNAPAVGRDQSLLEQVPSSVTVHRTWTLDLPFALRKAIKKLLSRPRGSSGSGVVTSRATAPSGSGPGSPPLKEPAGRLSASGMLRPMRSVVANLLLPDPQIGWLPFAFPAARRIIRSRNIDVVVITVPPFSSVGLATRLRKAFPALPIVVDFRDEWITTTLSLVSFNANARARAIAHQTESAAVRAATAVVCVTEAAVHELRKRYPDQPEGKFHCIPNGFETAAASKPDQTHVQIHDHDTRVVLTYVGSVYGSTDPRSFLEAVAGLPPEARAQLRIRFIGHVETAVYRQALDALSGVVETVGFLPQAEALRQLRQSDYALLLTHDPINVSAKFYDYLGAGIPILAAVRPEGEVRRLLEAAHAGWWADIDSVPTLQRCLLDAIDRVRAGAPFQASAAVIAQYHRKPLAQRYAALLTQLTRATP